MIINSNLITENKLNCDICIVGTGPASMTLISKYLNTKKKIIIVESGNFAFDKTVQKLNNGLVEDFGNYPHENYSLNAARIRKIGGTSNVWAGWSSPLIEQDFRKRKWINNSGWPISLEDLKPYYIEAQNILELSRFLYDESVFEFYPNELKEKVLKEYDNYFWQFSRPPVNFSKKYINQIKYQKNIELYYNLTLTKLVTNNSSNNIEIGLLKNQKNIDLKIYAKKYILGCGAIENASILLNSGKNNFEDCYHNVGKYFMEHPHCTIAYIKNFKDKEFFQTYNKNKIRNLDKKYFMPGVCLKTAAQKKEQVLNCINVFMNHNLLEIESAVISRYILVLKGLPISVPQLGTIYLKNYYKIYREISSLLQNIIFNNRNIYIISRLEQSPNVESKVYLSNKTNKFNTYLPNLKWRMNNIDRKTLFINYKYLEKTFDRLNLGDLKKCDWLTEDNRIEWDPKEHNEVFGVGHHMGTTRMSFDKINGVVDRNLKVHGINNLYVIGSSVFPTSGCVNPTLSIVALSLRLYEYLENN